MLRTSISTLLFLLLINGSLFAQQTDVSPYFPSQIQNEDWKIRVDLFASEDDNSNAFTNEFIKNIRDSRYLSNDLINEQVDHLSAPALSGSIRSIGGGFTVKSSKFSYYIGLEHQHFLDTYIDEDLIKLLLKGNKPFVGETLQVPGSAYSSMYFNQVKGGIIKAIEKGEGIHTLSGKLALNLGQNYDHLKIENSTFYTQPDGDYLEAVISADTKLSDTVWAEVYEVLGIGASIDLNYNYYKKEGFFVGIKAKNLGFISWNKNTFVASVDTSFVFEGLNTDTTGTASDELPDDYSYNSLRRLIFKNTESDPFATGLPVILNLTAGKYLAGETFYAGINTFFYPTLEANYKLELFATWNYKHLFQLTPIVAFSSYDKVNYGLGVGVNLGNKAYIQAGSAYLNSFFNEKGIAGTGGYLNLIFLF